MSTNDYVRNVGCATLLNLIYIEHSVNDESDAACDKRGCLFFYTVSESTHPTTKKGKTKYEVTSLSFGQKTLGPPPLPPLFPSLQSTSCNILKKHQSDIASSSSFARHSNIRIVISHGGFCDCEIRKNSFPSALLLSTLPHGLRAMFPAASFTDRNKTIVVEISDLT
ncbi:hypothetical protein ALC56_06558 [Trachymyrmex septentrionalis]|uniref:Uncharacterized protein n=1 Tax=Trachymyrmex septentrionalis TaxID=34720 RepID=A0A195FFY0_9HYME|nr:hypothetical protein ALC56_06558 [Trachymyrmex septentrionalis]